jgi:DNA repair protein SbcC/Rad50
MIDTDILKNQLSKYYDKIDTVTDYIFKCQKVYNNNPYQYYYFDFSNSLSDINIAQYSKKLISEDYYSQPNLMQWNYYLAFLIEKGIDPLLKNKIEQNEDFARKFVLDYNELDKWLYRTYKTEKSDTSELTEDLADVWRKILEKNNLDCVYSKEINYTNGIKGIITGKYKKEKVSKKTKKEIDHKLISFGNIQSLNLIDFREYPKYDMPFEFGKVNLIEGANGFGKTSLLEAIEFLFTGNTLRSDISRSYNVEGSFSKNPKLVSTFDNNALFRDRDRVWYGGMTAQRGSKLNDNFNKFSYFNTDAAFKLTHEKDQQNIEKAFKDIALGEDLNYLKREIENYKSKVEIKSNSRAKEIVILQNEIDKEKSTLKEIEKAEKSPEKLFKILIKELEKKKWARKLPTTVDDDLDTFHAELSKLQILFNSLQKDADFIKILSIDSLNKEKLLIDDLLVSMTILTKDKSSAENKVKILQKNIKKNELHLTLIQKILPYYSNDTIEKIIGLNDKIKVQLKKVKNLTNLKNKFEKIDTSAFTEEKLIIVKKQEALKAELEALNKHERELSKKIGLIKKGLTELQNIRSQIRSQGLEFIKINSDANECPLCMAKYTTSSDLKKRIEETSTSLISSNILSDVISEKESIIQKIKQFDSHFSSLKEIISITNELESVPEAIEMPLNQLLPFLNDHFMRIKSLNSRLEELQLRKEKYLSKGINENQYLLLKEELDTQTEFGLIKSKLELEKVISRIKEQVLAFKKNLIQIKESIEKIEYNLETLLKQYDGNLKIPTYENSLEVRKSNIEHYITELESDEYILQITRSENIRIRFKEINKFVQMLNNVREEKKHKTNADIVSKKANNTITANEQKIKKLTDENNKLTSVLSVFLEISEQYNEEEHFEIFFNDNRKEIQRIFLAIHSPKEFTELSIESGKIKLTRDNLKKDGLQNISAGQRSALAISVFLALNNKLKNGPNLLMFDDPVSFTDDLNILSFIDYLRQIALDKPNKQIFFATANENVAFLFRKKFEILGEDFKRISLKR